jgi:hypothetical protein
MKSVCFFSFVSAKEVELFWIAKEHCFLSSVSHVYIAL